jgi:hypothetical protein
MSLAAAVLLAAATAHAAPVDTPVEPDRGAQVDTARISVSILRPAVLAGGELVSNRKADSPRSQRQSGAGYVTYLFE